MTEIIQFAVSHPYLSGGLVLTVILLVWVEIGQRTRGFREVSPATAVPLINREDARVLDISSSADFQAGHIIGAHHAPKSQWEPVAQKLMKFPDRPVVIVDKNGQTSASAASAMVKAGLKQVVVLKGGMIAWRNDNYPVSRPAQKSKSSTRRKQKPKAGSSAGPKAENKSTAVEER